MDQSTCTGCGAGLTGRQTRFCSEPCSNKAATEARRPKTAEDRAKQSAYNKANRHRWAPKQTKECELCGMTYQVRSGERTRFCSISCAGHASRTKVYGPQLLPAPAPVRDMRSELRRAAEDGTQDDLIAAVKQFVKVDPVLGCWIWQRRIKEGYGLVRLGKRDYSVHRLVMGNPSQPVVHHTCARTACCNPDHLQLVTHRDNTAEMLERQYYLRRIAALEGALAEVSPGHPLIEG